MDGHSIQNIFDSVKSYSYDDLIILPGNFIFEKFKKNKSDTVVDHKSSDIDETTFNFPTEDSEDHQEIDSYKERDDNL